MAKLPVYYPTDGVPALVYPSEFCRYKVPLEYTLAMETQIYVMVSSLYSMLNFCLNFFDITTAIRTTPVSYSYGIDKKGLLASNDQYRYGFNSIPFRTEVADALLMGTVVNRPAMTTNSAYPAAVTDYIDMAPSDWSREASGDITGDHIGSGGVATQKAWYSQNPDLGAVHTMRKVICVYLVDLPLRVVGGSNTDENDRPIYGKLNGSGTYDGYAPEKYPNAFAFNPNSSSTWLAGYTTNSGQYTTNLTSAMQNIIKHAQNLHRSIDIYHHSMNDIIEASDPDPDPDLVDYTRQTILYNDEWITDEGDHTDQIAADAASVDASTGDPIYSGSSNSAMAHCYRVALLKELINMRLGYGWS